MSVIMGYIEILLDKDNFGEFSKEKQEEFLREAYRKGEALAQIIDDLFDISRIEAGLPLPIERDEMDLNDIIREVVSHYQKHTTEHQYKLSLTEEAKVNIDRNKMTQVIENLVSNAVKYSRDGGEIEVKSSWQENLLQVDIQDEGQGMSEEEVKRVFDKFYRANSSDTAISGLGLGMSIARQIIEEHQGTIRVESVEGQGTTVIFNLPSAAG
jgi:signal transduction histidine kinase